MTDVLVVGAGPAGNQVARSLRQQGREVTVLDYRERLGDKLCTGIVSSECLNEYRVSPELIYRPAQSARIFSPNGSEFRVDRDEPHAYLIDRAAFVAGIADEAAQRGASYHLGRRVVDMEITPSGVCVRARYAGRLETYAAKAVVIASGFRTSLARRAGLQVPGANAFAAQATITGEALNEVQVYARRHVPKGFFGWIAPTLPGEAYAGVLGRGKPLHALHRLLAALRAEGLRFHVLRPMQAWGVPLRPADRSYSDRCLLVGDAAGQIKPTTGGGIYYALKSGDMAADVLSEALDAGDLSGNALSPYENRWKRELGREIRLGYLARLVYERVGGHELDAILQLAFRAGVFDGRLSFDHHSDLFVRAVKSQALRGIPHRLAAIGRRVSPRERP